MFGFPINSQSNDTQKFTNNADSGFTKPGIREVFYSIKDGVWTDTTVWQTASGRVGKLPTANDDVYIRNLITLPSIGGTVAVNNLYITKQLTFSFQNLQVVNIQCIGILNMQTNASLLISGNNNRIDNLITGSGLGTSSITYNGIENQTIMPLAYKNLTLGQFGIGSGIKTMISDLVIDGTLTTIGRPSGSSLELFDSSGVYSVILDVGFYNLTVNSNTAIGNFSYIRKYNLEGNLLFLGTLSFTGGLPDFIGNISVEMRGGLSVNTRLGYYNCGSGIWRFTTNNQTVNHSFATFAYTNKFEIADGITVTTAYGGGGGQFVLNDTINGLGATSSLVMGNNTNLYFATAASVSSMTTGIFDRTTNANTIQYNGNYSATIPSAFSSFHSLTISGTGTKTLGANTTLNGNLVISSNGVFDLSTYNIDITGTSTINSTATLNKSGAGNILFIGQLNVSAGSVALTGNPTIEFRGGFTQSGNPPLINFGSGDINITTNNQEFYNNQTTINFDNNITIADNITLTFRTQFGFGTTKFTFNKPINGATSTSTLITKATLHFNTLSSATIMATGIFDFTTFLNEIGYTGNYSHTIPSTFSSFYYLTISGTGIKSISTNTTIQNNLSVSLGSLELSTYDLSVLGQSTLRNTTSYAVSKSGSGSLLFAGLVDGAASNNLVFDFSLGNPSVEFRNGLFVSFFALLTSIKSGTGVWSFTTNNQSITQLGGTSQLDCSVLISGAITLTMGNGTNASTFNLLGTINGNNAASTLRMAASTTVNYQSATQPMATGILDTSTNLNTWIYGLNNQDIKGSPTISPKQVYRNLTLNGTGTKTLQGYVSVLNTYTLTAPATLALNGFTLTNP